MLLELSHFLILPRSDRASCIRCAIDVNLAAAVRTCGSVRCSSHARTVAVPVASPPPSATVFEAVRFARDPTDRRQQGSIGLPAISRLQCRRCSTSRWPTHSKLLHSATGHVYFDELILANRHAALVSSAMFNHGLEWCLAARVFSHLLALEI